MFCSVYSVVLCVVCVCELDYCHQLSTQLQLIIIYHIISYHIISYHIISYHIISYHIISYHIISYHIISYHIISYHVISYHTSYIIHLIVSYQFSEWRVIICLYCVKWSLFVREMALCLALCLTLCLVLRLALHLALWLALTSTCSFTCIKFVLQSVNGLKPCFGRGGLVKAR